MLAGLARESASEPAGGSEDLSQVMEHEGTNRRPRLVREVHGHHRSAVSAGTWAASGCCCHCYSRKHCLCCMIAGPVCLHVPLLRHEHTFLPGVSSGPSPGWLPTSPWLAVTWLRMACFTTGAALDHCGAEPLWVWTAAPSVVGAPGRGGRSTPRPQFSTLQIGRAHV